MKLLTLISILWRVLCYSIMLHQVIRFLQFILSEPLGSQVSLAATSFEEFDSTFPVCMRYRIPRMTVNESFGIGYTVAGENDFFDKLSPVPGEPQNVSEVAFERLNAEAEKTYLKDWDTYLDHFGVHFKLTQKLKNSAAADKVNHTLKPLYFRYYHSDTTTYINTCGFANPEKVKNFRNARQLTLQVPNINVGRRKAKPGGVWFLTSLYGVDAQDSNIEMFDHNRVGSDTGHTLLQVSKDVTFTKFTYVNTSTEKCLWTPEEVRPPAGHMETLCMQECMWKAIAKVQRCHPLPVYLKLENRDLPACHVKKFKKDDPETIDEHKKCIENEKCEKRKACTEWVIKTFQTKHQMYKGVESPTLTADAAYMLDYRMVVVKQFHLQTLESILANLGGLLGMWCGFAMVNIFGSDAFVWLGSKLTKRKDKVEDDAVE